MQVCFSFQGGRYELVQLPESDALVMAGIKWGSYEEPLTPAFWRAQCEVAVHRSVNRFRLGKNLKQEMVYCLLGGFGSPAEIGLAAAKAVCVELDQRRSLTENEIHNILKQPFKIGNARRKYRFAAQRARYLSRALNELASLNEAALSDVELRNRLCKLSGIGPKTASWIVRNYRTSDDVAILDVHIVRACQIMGLFDGLLSPARNYYEMEAKLLTFCRSIGVRASVFDDVVWATMRSLSKRLLQQIVDSYDKLLQPHAGVDGGGLLCPVEVERGVTTAV